MRQLVIAAPAKINLSLDVVSRRADGYHLLQTVMQSIALDDQVTMGLLPADNQIQISCDRPDIPLNEKNTAWKAARLFLDTAGITAGLSIAVEKRIPAAAGLAGGSTDAAAVLFALNQIFPGYFSRTELFNLAARIGADVPFCLQGGTVFCEGIGDQLTPLPPFDNIPVLLLKPDFELSTPWVYSHLDLGKLGRQPDQTAILEALRERDLAKLAASSANVLESVSLEAHPVLQQLKDMLGVSGATLTLMSGSGPTVFGLFGDCRQRDLAREQLLPKLPPSTQLISTRTINSGPRILSRT